MDLKYKRHNKNIAFKLFFTIVPILLCVNILPSINRFYYKYELNGRWNYETLKSPVNFFLYKSHEQIEEEKRNIAENMPKYYYVDRAIADRSISSFRNYIYSDKFDKHIGNLTSSAIDSIFSSIINEGIVPVGEDTSMIICLENGRNAKYVSYSELKNQSQSVEAFNNQLRRAGIASNSDLAKHARESIVTNVKYDENKNRIEYEKKSGSIAPTYNRVSKNSIIAVKGQIINDDVYNKLNSLKKYYQEHIEDNTDTISTKLLRVMYYLLIILSFFFYFMVYHPKLVVDTKSYMILFLSVGIIVLASYILENYLNSYVYMVPLMMVPIILRTFFNQSVAFAGLILTIILIAIILPEGYYFAVSNIITGVIVILSLSKLERRSRYFLIIFVMFLSYTVTYVIYTMLTGGTTEFNYNRIVDYAVNAVITFIAYPLIFYIEKVTGITTAISLIEYSNTNNKLLRELSNAAPGTFQHSIQVSNLAESAARAIGANVLLTRVGALYHDIGKMENPHYFSENQHKNKNIHENLTPKESAEILLDHVRKGIETATKYHLPEDIKYFIRCHHGTRPTSFFYNKAVEMYGEENVTKKDFQYPGPEPISKETAIVMMADSVEAVSKSMSNADEESIISMVNGVIDKQISERQFDNTDITFHDIETIKQIFIARLKAIFHTRVKYPG